MSSDASAAALRDPSAAPSTDEPLRLGFLTALLDEQKGYLGGYLITSPSGRPLEFQCSTPVKPNRTQEILYGPTLEPFVLGELIARTLVEKAGLKPAAVFVDAEPFLALREHTELPVVWIWEPAVERRLAGCEGRDTRDDMPQTSVPASRDTPPSAARPSVLDSRSSTLDATAELGQGSAIQQCLSVNGSSLRYHSAFPQDRAAVKAVLSELRHGFDLTEPFERIRNALAEAHQSRS